MAWKRLLAGGLSGILATVPMTLFMLVVQRCLPESEQYAPPQEEIVDAVAQKVGTHDDPEAVPSPSPDPGPGKPLEALSLLAHFGYGMVSGVVYAALAAHRTRHPVRRGLVFGLLLWAAGYLGWLPALGILTPATQHPRGRTAMMIGAHLIWGPACVWLVNRWEL